MTGGYLQLRRGLFEHVTDGRMSYIECFAYVVIMAHADPETGIWIGSAGVLSSLYGLPARTARDVLEKLESKRYIKRFPIPGSHSNYPILVNKYECSHGAVKGMRLNTHKTIDYKKPVYESCEESGERGVKQGAVRVPELEDKREIRIKAPKKPALEPPTHEFFDEAKRLFEDHFGEPPTWGRADHVQLAELRKKKSDLTLATFAQRFQNFLNSPAVFHKQKGGSLKWFCPNWDKFINPPTQNGDGSGTGPFVVRPGRNPGTSSPRGEDILRNAVKGAPNFGSTVRTA